MDLCEFAYGFKDRPQFLEAYHGILNRSVPLSAVPDLYRSKMRVGFGLWLDYGGVDRWNLEDFSKNHFTPETFQRSLQTALEVSDEYVWIYSHAPRLVPPSNLPEAYLTAVRSALEAVRTAAE